MPAAGLHPSPSAAQPSTHLHVGLELLHHPLQLSGLGAALLLGLAVQLGHALRHAHLRSRSSVEGLPIYPQFILLSPSGPCRHTTAPHTSVPLPAMACHPTTHLLFVRLLPAGSLLAQRTQLRGRILLASGRARVGVGCRPVLSSSSHSER